MMNNVLVITVLYVMSLHFSLFNSKDLTFGPSIEEEISQNVKFKNIDDDILKNSNDMEAGKQKEEACNGTKQCKNGGLCLKHTCLCLSGTSGAFCEIVNDCEQNNLCSEDRYTSCEYDVEKQKAYCRCSIIEYMFDSATKTCRECECNVWYRKDPKAWSYCEYQHGQKICTCRENYSYDPKSEICSSCDCGKNSLWCEFNAKGDKVCGCKEGYSQYSSECRECDCGIHGYCKFSKSWSKYIDCFCDEGYEEYNQSCYECSCGKYGKCIYNVEGKQIGCQCINGYAEKFGKCEMCFCGDDSNCTFNGNQKICQCSIGYENFHGFCEDIDDCKKHNPCGIEKICINTLGSYECECKDGFTTDKTIQSDGHPGSENCLDIDECENGTICTHQDADCINTLGSYVCICKSGFIARGGSSTNIICEVNTNRHIFIYVGMTALVGLTITVVFSFYVKKYLQNGTRNNLHELN